MLRACFCFAVTGVLVGAAAATTHADIITLGAVEDANIIDRPSAGGQRDTPDNGSLLQVRNGGSNSTTGDRRYALFQFDLSSIAGPNYTIVGAHYELFDTGTGGAQTATFTNDNYLVFPDAGSTPSELTYLNAATDVAFDASGMHSANVTYNSYAAATGDTATEFWTELSVPSMAMTLAADNAVGYQPSGAADAATLTLLNTLKDDVGFAIFLNWRLAGFRTFGDIESGNAPQLVLDVAIVPEPTAFSLLGMSVIGLGFVRSRRRK